MGGDGTGSGETENSLFCCNSEALLYRFMRLLARARTRSILGDAMKTRPPANFKASASYRSFSVADAQSKTRSSTTDKAPRPAFSGAPPVYRPVATTSQLKPAGAPPVYRPVAPAAQAKNASVAAPAHSGAPPIYRPFAATSQLKPSSPAVYRPQAGAPPVYRPFTATSHLKSPGAPPVYCPVRPAAQPKNAFCAARARWGAPSVYSRQSAIQRQTTLGAMMASGYTKAGTVIQLAPSIRTADDNIKGLEAGTLAYPGVTAAKYADQFTSFTFKDTTYHISYMAAGDYHITDESAGRVHYFFKIGNDELEDRKPSMPSKSKPQNDKKLSDLPADVYEFVQTLFKQDLMSPEDEETIEGMVQDFLKGEVYDNPKEARKAALEAFADD